MLKWAPQTEALFLLWSIKAIIPCYVHLVDMLTVYIFYHLKLWFKIKLLSSEKKSVEMYFQRNNIGSVAFRREM